MVELNHSLIALFISAVAVLIVIYVFKPKPTTTPTPKITPLPDQLTQVKNKNTTTSAQDTKGKKAVVKQTVPHKLIKNIPATELKSHPNYLKEIGTVPPQQQLTLSVSAHLLFDISVILYDLCVCCCGGVWLLDS